jgi:hypothetical protein
MSTDQPWLDDPAAAAAPWLSDPAVNAPVPKSPWQQVKERAAQVPVLGPLAETAWGVGSSAIAGPLSGYVGAVGAMLPGPPGQGADWVRKTQDALTYEPTSKSAQTTLDIVGWPGAQVARLGDWAGNKTDEAFGPAAGAAMNATVNVIPMTLGVRLPGMKTSALQKVLPDGELPGTLSRRNEARIAALQSDTAATAAREAGFVLPPSQVNPSLANRLLEGAGGKAQLAQELSAKNQRLMQEKIRGDLGIEAEAPLAPETFDAARRRASGAYGELAQAAQGAPRSELLNERGIAFAPNERPVVRPGLSVTDDFRTPIAARRDAILAKLTDAPETFASLKPSVKLLDEALAKNEIDPKLAIDRIRQLRADAKADFASPNPAKVETAHTRLSLANDLEGLIEQNLTEKGDVTALARFREARKDIAKSYTAEKATLPSGEVRAGLLANELKRGIPLEGGMAEIANLGAHFPKAAQIPSRTGGTTAISPLDVSAAVLGHSLGGGGGSWLSTLAAALRAPARAALKNELYQKLLVNPPTYGPSLGSRMVRGLQAPETAVGATALGQGEEARRRAALLQALQLP